MRDKKNFSTLGKIDEKFVEEAESYSVSETEKAKAKRKKRVFAEAVFLARGGRRLRRMRGDFVFFTIFFRNEIRRRCG